MIDNIQYFHECKNSAHNRQHPVTDLEGEGDTSFSSQLTEEESCFDMTTWNDDEEEVQLPSMTREELHGWLVVETAKEAHIFPCDLDYPMLLHSSILGPW